MPSPDITPYLDLSLQDADAQVIYEIGLQQLQSNLPDWVPREGNIENLLLEAFALQVSQTVFAINRLPGGITEVVLKLFGIERDTGTPPVVNLTFGMAGTIGYTIPEGTAVRLVIPGGLAPIIFTTDGELVISPGGDIGTITATGDRFTDDANNIVADTPVELLDAITYVETVVIDSVATPGSEPESDEVYFTRATARFGRLSDTLVLPRHFTAYALEQPNVYRAFTIDNWDSVGGSPGDDPGHVTVAVYGQGSALSGGEKTALESAMEAACLANLDVHVIDPTITAVNVTVTVRALPRYDSDIVEANVIAALNDYLNPATWGWGGTVRLYELVTLINNVAGVDYIESFTTPNADVALTGNAPLADAGTLTVTVNPAVA